MAEVYKMFQHEGARTPATDQAAEELACHAVLDRWPDVEEIRLVWTQHHQPDIWLLFATGRIPE